MTAAAPELVSSVNAGALTAPPRAEAGLVTTGSGVPAGVAEAAVSATVAELVAVVEPFASAGPAASAVPEIWLIKTRAPCQLRVIRGRRRRGRRRVRFVEVAGSNPPNVHFLSCLLLACSSEFWIGCTGR